jgi:head-tail adaptor
MRAGTMRHIALLQAPSTAQTPSGAPVRAWSTVATTRVAMIPISGREFAAGTQGRHARVLTQFRMRFIPGVQVVPRMRLVVDGRPFDIKDVQDLKGLKHELLLMAEELVEVAP